MSVDVVQLSAAEFEEGMDFLNEVFGEHRPHNFATLLPAIYQPTDELMACNRAVRVDGVIKAIVGLFPKQWHVGDTVLKVGGIGGVSTHKSARGAGYMSLLMTHCVQVMRDEGHHLSWLGGQRQRYGYFGYEKCGTTVELNLTPDNLRHALPETDIRFQSMGPDDTESLQFAHRLHQAQPSHCERSADMFYRNLISWYHEPHLARNADGDPVAYLVANEDGGQILELVATDDEVAQEVAGAWVRQRGQGANFVMADTATGLQRRLSALAEGVQVSPSGNWQIYDWARTVEALLRLRSQMVALSDGEVVLGIEGYGTLVIRVRDSQVDCQRTQDSALVTWSPFVAMRALFGPLPPEAVVEVPREVAAINGWCPLPLGWSRQDGV